MHRSRSFIALIAGSAVCALYLVYLGVSMTKTETASIASRAPASQSSAHKKLSLEAYKALTQSLEKMDNLKVVSNQDFYSCDCAKDSHDHKSFDYEIASQCGASRNQFETSFRKIPNGYGIRRQLTNALFPRLCIIYVMNNTMGKGDESRKDLANCSNPSHPPVRGATKACVTPNYVNPIFNYFVDVADCMGFPQKDFLPKIFNESGFHINAYGPNNDAGIGQLTGPAIEEANKEFGSYKQKILSSSQESCRRLAPQVEKLTSVSHRASRCGFISSPDNPLRNLMYMGITYHQNLAFIDRAMADLNILERMKALGLPESKFEKEKLTQILLTLGYNAGAYSAVILLSNYLKRMEHLNRKISRSDFDFSIGITENRSLDPQAAKTTTFPGYLLAYQATGTAGYVTRVRSFANDLNSAFKPGVCVPESYLAL